MALNEDAETLAYKRMAAEQLVSGEAGRRRLRRRESADRDPAGELGITESDVQDTEVAEFNPGVADLMSRTPVWPDLGPDMATHISNTRRAMYWLLGCLIFSLGGIAALLVKALT